MHDSFHNLERLLHTIVSRALKRGVVCGGLLETPLPTMSLEGVLMIQRLGGGDGSVASSPALQQVTNGKDGEGEPSYQGNHQLAIARG